MSLQPQIAGERAAIAALAAGRQGDPFALLGPHDTPAGPAVRAYFPGARAVSVLAYGSDDELGALEPVHAEGFFAGRVDWRNRYRLRIRWPMLEQITPDPYSFGLLLGELDLHLIAEGRHRNLAGCLGAQPMRIDDVEGVRFALWAPNAERVSVVGDFNQWDGRRAPMRKRAEAGVWELFLPQVAAGSRYKFEILGAGGLLLPLKADPCASESELPPATASLVPERQPERPNPEARPPAPRSGAPDQPISIYEVHAGSWLRRADGGFLGWDELAERLIAYTVDMGFTHLEFLPITEHPFDGSWGYQPIGLFAPTARFGRPEGFQRLVDRAHAAGLGILLDWVPGHFPSDPHGLGRFDGTALYEHADPREGFHRDWNTLIYNFGRNEVRGYLIGSALHWLEHYRCDGLRVDAVASMLYRDYSRPAADWIPNVHGGRENLEAIAFLRELNGEIAARAPHAVTMAEESTAWPGVSRSVGEGGLGFGYKWNMGWMHDSLQYIARDPLYRQHHHHELTFGLTYAFSERFVLPLSHDEVVHGKGSLLGKMPGDHWQKFANLRAYFGFMFGHPGKKLLFMGGEFAQEREWSHQRSLDWDLLDRPLHKGMQHLVRDLNRLYAQWPALHRGDAEASGFSWVIGDDAANSVYAFLRRGRDGDRPVLVICNFTPLSRAPYRVGVPAPGHWREIFNSDAALYGGGGVGNLGGVVAEAAPAHGQAQSLSLTLPPLSTLMLVHD